ncbi:hypothetical protein GQ607_015647 [Colletotrichum asianum]|uniref:Uncharacterized protein n=1 Tax=Colletotrichum asianum TaxID=702518 RepID=A0A8H3VZD9_9PEZI|nr:hypothetical protein GQ607_015647 [Colletotrichum asianum]
MAASEKLSPPKASSAEMPVSHELLPRGNVVGGDAGVGDASCIEVVFGGDADVEQAFVVDDAVVEGVAAAGHGVADRRNLRASMQCIPSSIYDAVSAMPSLEIRHDALWQKVLLSDSPLQLVPRARRWWNGVELKLPGGHPAWLVGSKVETVIGMGKAVA